MHVAEIFRLPFAVLFWIVFFFAFVREGRVIQGAFVSESSAQDAGSFRALMIGSPVSLVVAIAASFAPHWTIPHETFAASVGIVLLIAGAVLRRVCFRTLGTSFTGSVVVRPDQAVVRHGVYRWVRHPSYTAAFLMFVGIGLALGSWISVAILFFAHCVLYGNRVVVEEQALLATLGEPYRDYMSRTKRFIPFVI
jgi:protein-S-isoprenylcysteine O-methyltransferase Ste14